MSTNMRVEIMGGPRDGEIVVVPRGSDRLSLLIPSTLSATLPPTDHTRPVRVFDLPIVPWMSPSGPGRAALWGRGIER